MGSRARRWGSSSVEVQHQATVDRARLSTQARQPIATTDTHTEAQPGADTAA